MSAPNERESQVTRYAVDYDVNTAHREIDLARPKQNVKSTGFLPEERAWLDRWTAAGYVDTFRHCYPDAAGAYTWWLQWGQARERNIGWRLDYFFVTPDLATHVLDAYILPDVTGSDHCPVGLALDIPGVSEIAEAAGSAGAA